MADLGRLSALEAPHRIYDAILRDSSLDSTLFRPSPVGPQRPHLGWQPWGRL